MYHPWSYRLVLAIAIASPATGAADEKELAALVTRAVEHQKKGELSEAIALMERVWKEGPDALGKDNPVLALIADSLGQYLQEASRFDRAIAVYTRSLEIVESNYGKNHLATAPTLHQLARAHHGLEQFDKAIALYQRSFDTFATAADPKPYQHTMGRILLSQASLHSTLGQPEKAEPLFARALTIFETSVGKDHPDTAAALVGLAFTYSDLGQFEKMERLSTRALKILEDTEGKDAVNTGLFLVNLANAYRENGRYEPAVKMYERALAIFEAKLGKKHLYTAIPLNNLGIVYYLQGHYPQAEEMYRRASAIGPDDEKTLVNYAKLLADRREFATAEPLFLRALALTEKKGKNHPDTEIDRFHLAVMYADSEQAGKALEQFHAIRTFAHAYIGRVVPTLAEKETTRFLETKERERLGVALSFGLQYRGEESVRSRSAEWLVNGKAIGHDVLSQRQFLIRGSSDPIVGTAFRELVETRRQLAALAVQDVKPELAETRNRRIAELETGEQEQSERISRLTGRNGSARPWIGLAELRRALPADGVYVDIVKLNRCRLPRLNPEDPRFLGEHYVAWIVSARDVQIVDLGKADTIDAAIRAAREAIEKSSARLKKEEEAKVEADAVEKLAAVAKRVFEPFQPHLGGVKNLILSPDGDLWLLPWAALPIGQDRYLIEEYAIRFVVHGRDLLPSASANQPAPTAPLILADPDYDLSPNQVAAAMRHLGLGRPIPPARLRLLSRRCPGKIGTWNVSFEFQAEKAVIRDEDNGGSLAGEATWTLDDGQLTMKSAISTFIGRLTATEASGERVKESDGTTTRDRWEFQLPTEAVAHNGETRSASLESKNIPKAPRLPGTVPESRQAFAKLKALTGQDPKLYKEAEASEAIVKATKSPKFLLLATHGFFLKRQKVEIENDKSPPATAENGSRAAALLKDKDGTEVENPLLRCGLLLAGANKRAEAKEGEDDGILTGLEIVGLDLRGTQFVILSACETGVGDVHTGEGVAGLRQAFQLAGAENVLATLWQINDEATVRLMNTFYDELAKGTDRAESLTRAQRQFLKERRERFGAAHPYFWASFTMTGK